MIARMLHLPPDRNKLHDEKSAQLVKECMAEYKIENRSVNDILDQICKNTDLYPSVKQQKSKKDGRGAFYAIHSRWLGPNHVNKTEPEAELVFPISVYYSEKKWNWKYVAHYFKYHIILGNLMEYGYQDLAPGSKVWYLVNGIRCNKLSIAVTAVKAHADKYEKDFDAVVTFLTQYINKRWPTPSVEVAVEEVL